MNPGRPTLWRLLAGGALAAGALAATTVPASAAVTATFNAGTLSRDRRRARQQRSTSAATPPAGS